MLLTHKPVGAFLVRVSESRFAYSLSFRVSDRCKHYMIDQVRERERERARERERERERECLVLLSQTPQTPEGKYYVVGNPYFGSSLNDLVKHFLKNPVNEVRRLSRASTHSRSVSASASR